MFAAFISVLLLILFHPQITQTTLSFLVPESVLYK